MARRKRASSTTHNRERQFCKQQQEQERRHHMKRLFLHLRQPVCLFLALIISHSLIRQASSTEHSCGAAPPSRDSWRRLRNRISEKRHDDDIMWLRPARICGAALIHHSPPPPQSLLALYVCGAIVLSLSAPDWPAKESGLLLLFREAPVGVALLAVAALECGQGDQSWWWPSRERDADSEL